MPRRGLPETIRMRHDEHYVEALTAGVGAPIGRVVPIDQVNPNPAQPRQVMGDLTELIASITEKGILEPLLVRQIGDRFEIVAGERRYHAAVQAGLEELPVTIRQADDTEAIELALIENLQRKDLTPFEEADALHSLASRCGYTHEDLARKLSRSRVSVTESLSLAKMPEEIRNLCRLADISSKSLLLEIVRQGDARRMHALVEKIASGQSVTREQVRRQAAKPAKAGARPRPFVFQYREPSKAFSFQLRFRKSAVERDEVIATLERILEELKRLSPRSAHEVPSREVS